MDDSLNPQVDGVPSMRIPEVFLGAVIERASSRRMCEACALMPQSGWIVLRQVDCEFRYLYLERVLDGSPVVPSVETMAHRWHEESAGEQCGEGTWPLTD